MLYAIIKNNEFEGKFEIDPEKIEYYHKKVKDVNFTNDYDKEIFQRFGPTFEWDNEYLYKIFKLKAIPGAKEILKKRIYTKFMDATKYNTLYRYTKLLPIENKYLAEEAKEAIETAIDENRLIEFTEYPFLDMFIEFTTIYEETLESPLQAAQYIIRCKRIMKKHTLVIRKELYRLYELIDKCNIKQGILIAEKCCFECCSK